MGLNTADERPVAAVGETNNFAVSFVGVLDSGELLSGTPTVAEQTTSDLTISNEAVNTSALTINDRSVAIGKAVQFSVSGQTTANSPYTLKITVSTDSSPAQTKVKYITFVAENA